MANQPPDRMDDIFVAIYAPLVLPQNLNRFLDDYLKHLPKFNGEGEVTAEEHLTTSYNFADNFNLEQTYIWMRLFAQSLDGKVRKWFRGLPINSIPIIRVPDDTFLESEVTRKTISII